MMSSQ